MKLVLFTFDYELFLGNKSGKVIDCLIKPSDLLVKELGKYNFKGIFFIDTVYLSRLEQITKKYPNAQKDYNLIINQLAGLVRLGHEIHPHIHPHWLDAVYLPDLNEWSLNDLKYYQFSSLPETKKKEIFAYSVDILRNVISNAKSNQRIDTYRAGGWSIQPFDSFYPFFKQYDIVNEMSIIPGKYHLSTAHSFDFRSAPFNDIYPFDRDVCEQNTNGKFREWTISSSSLDGFSKWMYYKVSGLYNRINKKNYKGTTVAAEIADSGDIYRAKNGIRMVASFEQLNPYILLKHIKNVKKSSYYHFISHPKLISQADFGMLRILLKQINKIEGMETDFRKAII